MHHRLTTVSGKRRPEFASVPGFSILEMLVVLIIIGVLVTIAVPKMERIVRHERVNRAAQVVVQDLQNGFALAGRQRAPVRLTFTTSSQKYVFSDRLTGIAIFTRLLSTGADFSLTSMTIDNNPIDILPNGIGTTAFRVTITNGDYSRAITASSAGFVRLVQ